MDQLDEWFGFKRQQEFILDTDKEKGTRESERFDKVASQRTEAV